jgi:tetratricopeptide (TPR) repeat protein
MPLHVFVAMPYGIKDGIDFNRVYAELIRPAIEGEGLDVFRADEERRAGDIRADMFQELLLADVVIADLSADNPNVWYELGVRHALRARGVISMACRQGPMPFDVYPDRKLRYHMKDGAPDADFVQADRAALATMVRETLAAWHGRKSSPVYQLLPFLQEPDWKTLRVGGVEEVWEQQDAWAQRLATARRKQRPSDVLVLADEAPAQALRQEAHLIAARTLRQLNQPAFALEQAEKALALDPTNLTGRQEKGMLLGRLQRYDEAREWLESVARDHPADAETCGLLGRLAKDLWESGWRKAGATPATMRHEAEQEVGLLNEAIDAYASGFRKDPRHCYSGINAATLLHVAGHLTGSDERDKLGMEIEGGVRWSARCELARETTQAKSYWARVTLADLELLVADRQTVEKAYAFAVAAAEKDWFALDSTWQQLDLLAALGFRPEQVEAALSILTRALGWLTPPWKPARTFLFSGHMIDEAGRESERFPEDMTELAAAAIAKKLAELGAGEHDLALSEGACGGDLLFAQAALDRGLWVELQIPFDEPEFIEKSIAFAGEQWVERYYKVKSAPKTNILVMPDELGPLPLHRDPYERANLWLLYTALAWGPDQVRFIALWNGEKSGKPGGTDHMMEAVRKRSGRVSILDTNSLLRQTIKQRPHG